MREPQHLRRRYRAIAAYVALICGGLGLLMLLPVLAILGWPGESRIAWVYLFPGLTLAVAGLGGFRLLDPGRAALTLQEGGVIVVLAWFAACLASAVPLAVAEGLSPAQALFESVSAWTTTGLSVVDVVQAHRSTLLWRSVMQLAGGAGLAIIMLAALTGGGGPTLSAAEGRPEQLVPNVLASARLVLRIYAGFVLFGVLALRAAGMGWFDATNHAFCALSTGGFSTRPESIGAWDSPAVEGVTIVLMILGATNFLTAWCLLRGRFAAVKKNGEVRLAAVLLPLFAVLLFWLACAPLYNSVPKACRVALFETVSALTSTGYSTVSYGDWSAAGVLLLFVLMLIGGATCSTAGGIKQFRVYLLFRALLRELRRPFLPRTAVVDESVWVGEERVAAGDARLRAVGLFLFLYIMSWLAGAVALAACGYSLRWSLFEFASALGTTGLSLGLTSSATPAPALLVLCAGMLLGRLEFFVVFAGGGKLARDLFTMLRPAPGENEVIG